MDSVWHKTKELLTYHCGCYGNLVTIATKYVAGVYHPMEPPYPGFSLVGGLGVSPYEPYVPPHKNGVPPYKIGKLSPLISIHHGGGGTCQIFLS